MEKLFIGFKQPNISDQTMSEQSIPRQRPSHMHNQELGAVTKSIVGWELPLYYESNNTIGEFDIPTHLDEPTTIGAEVLSTRKHVGINDGMVVTPVEIWGKASTEFVQSVFTNDMDMDVGRTRYTLLLNNDSNYLGDVVVSRLDKKRYFMFTAPSQVSYQIEWLREHSPEGVCITNEDNSYTCIGLYGPEAKNVIEKIVDVDMSRDNFPYFSNMELDISGIPTIANAVSYIGEYGWELWTQSGHQPKLWEKLMQAGQDHGITPFGYIALFSMSVEKGYSPYETNLTQKIDMVAPANTPAEANLDHVVDLDTDFIGKEALQDAMSDGIKKQLCCITMEASNVLPELGSSVYIDEKEVGEVIRSDYGYTVQENIVYSYLPIDFTSPGTKVEIDTDSHRHIATVREEPLYDPENKRMRNEP